MNKDQEMITPQYKEDLEKQQYRIVGHHSAVKVCGWTKNMIRGKGICYKFKFYGIRSHQCLQMTTSMFCANRCKFCWRGQKAPVSKEWYGKIDEPKFIVDNSIQEQRQLIVGFAGSETSKKDVFEEANTVKHVALSLTGEPITYPKIVEILDEFHKQRISTFLVTNGQYPEQLEKIDRLTQLYISIDAPNKKLLKDIDLPLFPDYYERLIKSLEIMKEKKYRTTLRITVIKDINDTDLEGYKHLIETGMPDFIEVKAYMYLGASREILEKTNMPFHEYVQEFSKKLIDIIPEYEIIDEHPPSRVLCLARKDMKNKQFINFANFFETVNQVTEKERIPIANDYSSSEMCENK
ncbi:4-demethylwyosine synthase TYW1 [archaeon]|jgi:tRNA wybutosine-synthesizing protein 1|nr:4-demethylwyosine synthase TYW1 [archaeon]MBT6868947.1 4-demethylwyosine synthase TYW1 [archaeon]MBT7192832.1 4-demethylwyosine synthase TYW1 [archaeon]MBT7380798.1 4-demethylwyosine synthase TYW1 [archaeon]MBT7507553.1 4-demethylwyosine synthase TYW1 [archaeon]